MSNLNSPNSPWILLRSLLFLIGIILITLIYGVFILPFSLLIRDYTTRYRLLTSWSWFAMHWLWLTCSIGYEIRGLENLPKDTAVLFMSKHQSAWETLAFPLFLPTQTWVMKKELLSIPLFGWGLAMLHPIAITRASLRQSMQQIVEQGTARLKAGISVIIFPEGTRTPPGERHRHTVSGGLLATESGFPVIPVALNSGVYWRNKSLLRFPGTIVVSFGSVINPVGKTTKEVSRLAEEWIEAEAQKLFLESQQQIQQTAEKN